MDISTLNDRQKEAVLYSGGALLILAGAGSGKTRVLTSRIAHLIQDEGVPAWNILAFTFTNKAAKEMKERVAKLLGRDVSSMWIGTFHSMCARILRRDIDKLGFSSSFTIYDSTDQKQLVKQAMKTLGITDESIKPNSVLHRISDAKNRQISADGMEAKAKFSQERDVASIFRLYESLKKENNALDFDDLILKTIELFREFPAVLKQYQQQFQFVFVDEYQDTNQAQYHLIHALAGMHRNICVVGDADQSIYGWRGADISNILRFEEDFVGTKTILLDQNYRSTKHILEAANRLIDNNLERKKKSLWTENDEGDVVQFQEVGNEFEEAQSVTRTIATEKEAGIAYEDMAILYRTNAQSRAFEESLIREGIPYRIIGGLKFYDRAEIKDLVAYMNLTVNPQDDIAFQRIVNQPKRGIGQTTVQKLQGYCRDLGVSLLDGIDEPEVMGHFNSSTQKKLIGFQELMGSLHAQVEAPMVDFAEAVYAESGYQKMLQDVNGIEERSRMENIDSFFAAIAQFQEDMPEATIVEYLQNLSLLSDLDKTKAGNEGISLMTIHSAKGLEFPVVFVGGLEDGLFPSKMTMDEGNLEEERRLFYVAITRAEKRLYLYSAKARRIFGKPTPAINSRFIEELGDTIETHSYDIYQDTSGYTAWPGDDGNGGHASGRGNGYGQTRYGIESSGNLKGFADPKMRADYDRQREKMHRLVLEKKAAKEANKSKAYRAGDKVKHKKFGEGTIVSVVAKDDGDELTIAFLKKGIKRLNASFAPLEKL